MIMRKIHAACTQGNLVSRLTDRRFIEYNQLGRKHLVTVQMFRKFPALKVTLELQMYVRLFVIKTPQSLRIALIMPINQHVYHPLQAHRPTCLLTILLIDHHAYRSLCPSTIVPINHHAFFGDF